MAYLLIQAVTHFAPLHQDTAGSLNLVGECGGGDTLVTSYNPPHTSGRERENIGQMKNCFITRIFGELTFKTGSERYTIFVETRKQ